MARKPEHKPDDPRRPKRFIGDRLKAELARAFATPDEAYRPLDADAVIERNARGGARADALD